jgi:hypothetical protein
MRPPPLTVPVGLRARLSLPVPIIPAPAIEPQFTSFERLPSFNLAAGAAAKPLFGERAAGG